MATYRHDYKAFGEAVLQAPFMVAEMKRRADLVADAARAIAPVGDPVYDSHAGRYLETITSSAEVRTHGTRRAVGTVTADSPEATFVEYGSASGTPAYHILARALNAAAD